MIGDDHFKSNAIAVAHFLHRPNATINSEHDLDALLGQPFQGFIVQSIAFIDAIGNVGHHIGAKSLQGLHQQRRRGDTVSIEIAINCNRLVLTDGPTNATDRL